MFDSEAGKRVSPDAPSEPEAATSDKRRKTEGGAVGVAERPNGAAAVKEEAAAVTEGEVAEVAGAGLSEGVGGKADEAAFWSSLEATPAKEGSPVKVSRHKMSTSRFVPWGW